MKPHEIEHVEINLLLEAVYQRYGYDFRSYSRASVDRRVRLFIQKRGVKSVSDLIPLLIHDPEVFSALSQQFSVSVSDMFRDPFVFRTIKEKAIPMLKTFAFVKAWAVGCATGEEVYSLAVLFKESGMLDRCTLFGTDFNDDVLEKARHGVFPMDRIQGFTRNYQESGGTGSFSDYYHSAYQAAAMNSELKRRITFANHNLAADQVFGEMHLVLCRNVLIYFNRELQNRALRIIADSLIRGGYFVMGTREDLRFSEVADQFVVVDDKARIYRKWER